MNLKDAAKARNSRKLDKFDVAILGTGIAGSMLGAVLAKNGARVLLIEDGVHPRFALGESTVPQTSLMMHVIADRYSVPEIKYCSSFFDICKRVTGSCGIKRNFGFVYHREGEKQNPQEATQSIIPEFPYGPESHLFRQDIDAYLFYIALRYGAVGKQRTRITGIDIDHDGVVLEAANGEKFQSRYVVDAGGFRSPLAERFNLRDSPERLKTHTRCVFTHMVDVKPYDECIQPRGAHKMPVQWWQGTLHQIFDGGWLWVIPFDNYPDARNPLCSIGLTLDSRRFPKTDMPPDQEFQEFLSRFPSIARQFKTIKLARDWVSTGRTQYASKQSVGDRFCLLGQASGAIDALFSRGMANTTMAINVVADTLLKAIVDDDFSAERFAHVERLQQNTITYNDRLVNCSNIAFVDFELWNAWYRIWAVGVFFGWLRLSKLDRKFQETHNKGVFSELDESPFPGSICPDLEQFDALFSAAASQVEAVEEGTLSSGQAARYIINLLKEANFIPHIFKIADTSQRHTPVLDRNTALSMFSWVKSSAPPEIKKLYFD